MTTASTSVPVEKPDDATYQRRIRAWTLYDWANSAFATTILAAVLPTYYSQVAGATLPSEAVATAYWSLGLSFSLFIAAIISPILGTVSDVMRGKKRFLSIFATIGIISTGLLVLVNTGDWLLASILFIFGRLGFTGSIVFYDALLPHVARSEDQDRVSTMGYAMGYIGGGLLLAINIVMIFALPDNWGPRLSFLSVAIWWAIFTIPVLRTVPEPPSAEADLSSGQTVIGASFQRIRETIRDIRQYRELFKYLVAFLIYNDAIGTIIGVAVIYGAELGFGTIELILALLLVQFAGIPFSLIFGRLPSKESTRRPYYLAFILFNLVALPLIGIIGRQVLPTDISGDRIPNFESTATAVGTGVYLADSDVPVTTGDWSIDTISADQTGTDEDVAYLMTTEADARYELAFNGQAVEILYTAGPEYGIFSVELDGAPILDDEGDVLTVDAYNPTVRYGASLEVAAEEAGEHVLTLINMGETNPDASSTALALGPVTVAEPVRENSLPIIMGILLAVQAVGIVFAFVFGRFFTGLANTLNTKRSIILALVIYGVIATWGFILDSTIEFWMLALMVAIVQGGSQALSRSLFASMAPSLKSGEFFGLYGVMEKFSAITGPLIFALAVALFGNSRPAILSLIVFFIIGGGLLLRVDVAEGQRVARKEDAATFGAT